VKSGALPVVAILAGGLATRLRPITERIPKSLVPVAGKPFLAHQLALLRAQNFHRVVLCVAHLGDQIEAAFGDGHALDMDLIYSHDGPGLAGTAGALQQALPLLGPDFLTLYGDSYLETDYHAIWSAHQRRQALALMTVIAREFASDPPNAWFENGMVRAYGKGEPIPEMRHVDYGLGVFNAETFACAADGVADLSDVQGRLARAGQLAGHEVKQPYFEIGSPRGLADLESHLRAQAK
jgi:NDP-sugar pyrophosphorylase family protein